ncbi:N-acetyltransferase [Dyella sp. C11]|uniref:GNAT family N-acetyltransferase n=1 Tax=Dyella sp. C11 TaxID=2126991 RepID=UPI000D64C973|nr:N-acetyltransferase [Dyella sp. C11]
MTLFIRPETTADIVAIHALTTEAFRHAAHTSHTEQFINDALREAGQLTLSLVADDKGEVVGHVAISPVTLSDGSHGWYGLGPVSVLPERQSEGIGAGLIHAALDTLRKEAATGCVVLGDPGYYARFGFRANPTLVLPGVPPEYFQSLVFSGPVPRATVSYHEAFQATGPS